MEKINPDNVSGIDFSDLEPRVQQIVTSYAAMFGHNDKEMERFKEFIIKYQEELIEERANSWEGQVVMAIHNLLERGYEHIDSSDIILEADLRNDHGLLLNPNALKNVLRELGFGKGKVVRIGDKTKRSLPLETSHLDSLFKRYSVTQVTQLRGTLEKNIKIEDYNNCEQNEGGVTLPIVRNNRNTVTCVTWEFIEKMLDNLPEKQADFETLVSCGVSDEQVVKWKEEGRIFFPHPNIVKLI